MVNCRWYYTEWFAVLYGIDIDRNFVVYLVCMRKFNPFKISFAFNACFCCLELTKFLKNNSISHVPQLLIVLLLHSNPCSMIFYALIHYPIWCFMLMLLTNYNFEYENDDSNAIIRQGKAALPHFTKSVFSLFLIVIVAVCRKVAIRSGCIMKMDDIFLLEIFCSH